MLTQKERIEVLKQDRDLRARDTSTMNSRAIAEAEDVRGRFAQINKSTVIGATSAPNYPAGPNWSGDPTGTEPPLGFSIDDHEPVGETFEVAQSLGGQQQQPIGAICAAADAEGESASNDPPALSPASLGEVAPVASADPADAAVEDPRPSPPGFEVAPTLRRLIRRTR